MVMPMVVGLSRADGLSDDDGVLVPETHLICGIQIRMVAGFAEVTDREETLVAAA